MPSDDTPLLTSNPRWTRHIILSTVGGVLGALQFGLATSALNQPEKYMKQDLDMSGFEFSLAVSIFAIGGLLGALSAGWIADAIGRRAYLALIAVPFAIAGALAFLAEGVVLIVLSRFIVGLGCGGATVVVPMYLKEVAPPHLKGAFGTLNQFSVVMGILISECLGFPLDHDHHWWRWSVGASVVPALLQIVLYPFMVPSPRWLLLKEDEAGAVRSLKLLRGMPNIEFELNMMRTGGVDKSSDTRTLMSGLEDGDGGDPTPSESGVVSPSAHARPSTTALAKQETVLRAGDSLTLAELWRDPVLRFALTAAIVLQLAQQFSGINAVFFYSTSLFEEMKFSNPLVGTVIAGAVNVVATGLAVWLMDRAGRRTLLAVCVHRPTAARPSPTPPSPASGSSIMIGSAILFTIFLEIGGSPVVYAFRVACILGFVTGFEVGLGPIPWLIGAELFSSRERGQAMSLSASFNWLSQFVIGLIFPPMLHGLGSFVFLPFAGVLVLVVIFVQAYVPETKGKSPEHVQAEIAARLRRQA